MPATKSKRTKQVDQKLSSLLAVSSAIKKQSIQERTVKKQAVAKKQKATAEVKQKEKTRW